MDIDEGPSDNERDTGEPREQEKDNVEDDSKEEQPLADKKKPAARSKMNTQSKTKP
ncbi:hypothetical protein CPB83DRAFT_890703 [Crepidotus variabilis]|uniref:Uncharacterized protein n=1 Tax=Crepidotus variabilis TaxID=179855 RepID=A0A9P6JSY9_9AGAR|nr:hypothetical protein CPB83DRAFT_890703 [Crepidotus variabilis]